MEKRVFIIMALLLAAVGLNAKDIDKPVDHIFLYCEIEGIKYKYDPETLTATVIESWRVNYENVWSVNENGDSTFVERHNYVPLTQGYHSVNSVEIPATIMPPGETQEYSVTTTADLAEQLEEYDRTFDSARYEQQLNLLLNEFKQDYQRFKEIVTDFCCN